MAYETKVILGLIARIILKSKTLKEAYNEVVRAANAEGIIMKPYDEAKTELDKRRIVYSSQPHYGK